MPAGKEVYVVLTDTGTWFSKLIQCFTRAPLNHASIAFDGGLGEAFSFGRKSVRNPFVGGLVNENFHHPFYRGADCAVYRFRGSRDQADRIYGRISVMMSQQDRYKYHFWGLFGVLLGTRIHRKDAYFCSQFVASLFEETGLPLLEKPSHLITPGDLVESRLLEEVFRGKVSEYLGGEAGGGEKSDPKGKIIPLGPLLADTTY